MTEYRDLIPVIVERENATLPYWCDSWGVKSVWPDLRTYGGYQWPYLGRTAACDPSEIVVANRKACPSRTGDGLCVATSWQGMASGCIPARTLLLVAYASNEVLGRDNNEGKLRTARAYVAALVDGERLLREEGHGADLAHANLSGANLYGADLYAANLNAANLARVSMVSANLRGAKLCRANLSGANLAYVDLADADLTRAKLRGANLADADLRSAELTDTDLRRADLSRADLRDANLRRANLNGANLRRADLRGADLRGALMPSERETQR